MPEIKAQHVVSCSAAETNHPAENLLKPEGTFKWKTPAGKNGTVVLQFEKASQIHSIDVGNEGSAFVEVLVGKSTSTSEEFQVLLVASAFMTPVESRNGTNRNSVRMFGPEKLSKAVADEKWDRVKIVCTQPFNKTSSFGLSFIKFHSPPQPGDKGQGEGGVKKLGAFVLKPDTADDIACGSLFVKSKTEKSESTPLKGAAAVRAASRLADESRPVSSGSSTPPRKPESTSSTKSTTATPSSKNVTPSGKDKPSTSGAKRKHDVSDDEDQIPKPSLKKQTTSLSSTASSVKDTEKPQIKRTKSLPPKESNEKAFHKLMEGVVFVMSGFQNPFRAELRDMATEMGAVYKPDWKKGCTHLICAFHNTPKYNQVKGKGKIVKKEWIQHMYKQKKVLPWRKYRLGDADTPEGSSEESEEEYDPTPKKKVLSKKEIKKNDSPAQSQAKKSPSNPTSKAKDTKVSTDNSKPKKGAIDNGEDTDSGDEKQAIDYGGDTDSGGDTEDELRRVKAKLAASEKENDPYENSTDEDEPSKKGNNSPSKKTFEPTPSTSKQSHARAEADDSDDSGLPELPDYFTDKHFFLYGNFPGNERRLLTRYIAAYNGELEEYMNDKVDFVITCSEWDSNFDDALSEHPKLVFVKPKWIHQCHEKEKLCPYQHHVVIPKDD